VSASDKMNPNASPGALGKTGVRRINSVPVYIVGGVFGIFLLILVMAIGERSKAQNTPHKGSFEQPMDVKSSIIPREIIDNPTSGLVREEASLESNPEKLEPAEQPVVLIARPKNLDVPPVPPRQSTPSEGFSYSQHRDERDDEAERIRMAKFQMLQEAVRAKTAVRVDAPRVSDAGSYTNPSATSTPRSREEMLAQLASARQQIDEQRSTDPTAAFQKRLAQVRSLGLADAGNNNDALKIIPSAVQSIDADAGPKKWSLNSKLEAPRSLYELRTGHVLPATLISGVNSELPGQIIAQVSENVCDTATGWHLLIPQGSRLYGSYLSDVVYGQNRVLVAWQRIIFPDGKALDIGAMPGADGAGYAGFKDKVNNHYLRIFGSALLMSGVIAGVSLSQQRQVYDENGVTFRQRAGDALSESLGQVLGNTMAQIISKNMNVAPTLEIRPGYRFNVIVTKDLTFSKPYQAFDY